MATTNASDIAVAACIFFFQSFWKKAYDMKHESLMKNIHVSKPQDKIFNIPGLSVNEEQQEWIRSCFKFEGVMWQ